MTLNEITLCGKIGNIKLYDKMATFGVGISRKVDGEWESTWWTHKIFKDFDKLQRFSKGDTIYTKGSLVKEKWTDKEGNEKEGVSIMCNFFKMAIKKEQESQY